MVTFKKREYIYRPYQIILKLAVDIVIIICATYLVMNAFFTNIVITGHSMNNTLNDDDKVLINRISYIFHDPERYDLIVFEAEISGITGCYVKRVIGLPGETVKITDGRVYIDGKELEDDVIKTYINTAGLAADSIKLAYDEYFVLGDNRNNSDDSRYSNIGLVKRENIIGRPWLRISPVSSFGIIKTKEIKTEKTEE